MTKDHPREAAPRPTIERRHIRHSPLFWVGALMFLAATVIYLWSEDLAQLPWG